MVGVVPAERRSVTESNEFVGRIEAIGRVDLRARVTGFIQEQTFREGQEVRAGEVLFRLERAPFEAEVARAQAQVAAAEAELANARIALNRARELVRTAAGTQVRVDDALAAERSANAGLLGAQAQLRVAQINLGYTEITAPIDGKIGRVTYTVGNTVSPTSQPLATIVSQDPMRVSFPVSLRTGGELRSATRRVAAPMPSGCGSSCRTASPIRRSAASISSTRRWTATPTPSWSAPPSPTRPSATAPRTGG